MTAKADAVGMFLIPGYILEGSMFRPMPDRRANFADLSGDVNR